MSEASGLCILISKSCTTSWFDWIHSELWLCPDGLLRRSLGLQATIRHARSTVLHGRWATVNSVERTASPFSATDLEQILRSGRRNRWICWDAVRHVTLKRGVLDHSLHIQLEDGGHEKLLWLMVDGGFDELQVFLQQRLPDRFTAWNLPFG